MGIYRRNSIEREGIDIYLNRTAFEHEGVDFDMFAGFVDRKMNVTNLQRAMNIKTRDTIEKYLKLYEKYKLKAEAETAVDSLSNV